MPQHRKTVRHKTVHHGILALLAAAVAALFPASRLPAAEPSHPNIILLVADDLRPDVIHALGHGQVETPNLDRLVATGTAFTRATCAHPLCVPSRAEIISGCTGFRTGVYSHGAPLPADIVPWPKVMQSAGYHTVHVGKWHLAGRPGKYGYDEITGMYGSGPKAPPQVDYAGRPVTGYTGWRFYGPDGKPLADSPLGLTPGIDAKFADAGIGAIEASGTRPLFLHVNFTGPHDPRLYPPGYEHKYDPAGVRLPANFRPEHPFDHGNLRGRDEVLLPFPRTPEDVRRELAVYYSVVTFIDRQVGRILDALEKAGQSQRSIVVFTADHGLAVGSHGLVGKQNMYEHTIGVPLVMSGPGIPRGDRCQAQCYLRDLYPTLCELAGVEYPKNLDARSLVPAMTGKVEQVYPFVVGYFAASQRMIRTTRWKLIRYPKVGREQLFDLKNDPDELHDLSGKPEHAELLAQLRSDLSTWLKEHGDTVGGG
jgi:arylsulfatase A-like enzyme